jgi:hypothetical protein
MQGGHVDDLVIGAYVALDRGGRHLVGIPLHALLKCDFALGDIGDFLTLIFH